MRVDITVWDEIGWRLPIELLTIDDIESDESVQRVLFEQIQAEALVQVCKDAEDNPPLAFSDNLRESIGEYARENNLEVDTLEDFYLTVKEWADVINETILAHAQNQLEDRESGDYWKE